MIEPLPTAFRSKERIYRQLARKGIVALFEVRNEKHNLIGFELIIVRYQKPRVRDTWKYPERERYPEDEEFGRYAWSFPSQTRELTELAFDHLSSMPFGRVKPLGNKDAYPGWGKGEALQLFRAYLRSVSTGRPLPKTGKISNATPEPTERLSDRTTSEPQ